MIVAQELDALLKSLQSQLDAVDTTVRAIRTICDGGMDPSKYEERIKHMDGDAYERHMSYRRQGGK